MSFPLDRLVTKNQMAADIFVVVSFRKENRPGCPLFKKKRQQKLLADIWCLVISFQLFAYPMERTKIKQKAITLMKKEI